MSVLTTHILNNSCLSLRQRLRLEEKKLFEEDRTEYWRQRTRTATILPEGYYDDIVGPPPQGSLFNESVGTQMDSVLSTYSSAVDHAVFRESHGNEESHSKLSLSKCSTHFSGTSSGKESFYSAPYREHSQSRQFPPAGVSLHCIISHQQQNSMDSTDSEGIFFMDEEM